MLCCSFSICGITARASFTPSTFRTISPEPPERLVVPLSAIIPCNTAYELLYRERYGIENLAELVKLKEKLANTTKAAKEKTAILSKEKTTIFPNEQINSKKEASLPKPKPQPKQIELITVNNDELGF